MYTHMYSYVHIYTETRPCGRFAELAVPRRGIRKGGSDRTISFEVPLKPLKTALSSGSPPGGRRAVRIHAQQ